MLETQMQLIPKRFIDKSSGCPYIGLVDESKKLIKSIYPWHPEWVHYFNILTKGG